MDNHKSSELAMNHTTKRTWVESHPKFGDITFTVSNRSKWLNLSVKPFQGLQVRLPANCSRKNALASIDKKETWVRKTLERAKRTEKQSELFYNSQTIIPPKKIRESLVLRLSDLAVLYNFSYNKVSIRNQKSRWGSCSSTNNISLNQKLYYLPDHLRDYVLLHELAHTLQKNHSPKFWDILKNIIGRQSVKQARLELRNFEFLFHQPPNTNCTSKVH